MTRPAGSSPLPLLTEHHLCCVTRKNRLTCPASTNPGHVTFRRTYAPDPPLTHTRRLRARLPATVSTAPSTTPYRLELEAPTKPHTGHFDRTLLSVIFSKNASFPHNHNTLSCRSAYHQSGSLGANHPSNNSFYLLSYNFLPKLNADNLIPPLLFGAVSSNLPPPPTHQYAFFLSRGG